MTNTVNYKGTEITIRGGAWSDPMNSYCYEVIDTIKGYEICREYGNNAIFALECYGA